MTKWTGETPIEHCRDPNRLWRFIERRTKENQEQGVGTLAEQAEFNEAVARLILLAA